jgi:hypothetical protein
MTSITLRSSAQNAVASSKPREQGLVKPRSKRCQRSSRFWLKAWRANWSLWKKTTQGESRGWARQHELEVVAPEAAHQTGDGDARAAEIRAMVAGMRNAAKSPLSVCARQVRSRRSGRDDHLLLQCPYSACSIINAEIQANNSRAQALASEQNAKVVQNVAAGAGQQGLRDTPGAPEGRGVDPGGAPRIHREPDGPYDDPNDAVQRARDSRPLPNPADQAPQFDLRQSVGNGAPIKPDFKKREAAPSIRHGPKYRVAARAGNTSKE